MTVAILPATAAHIAAVARIERECFSDPWSEKSFRVLAESPESLFLVATEADGSVIGYTAAMSVLEDGEILNVAVAPSARRKGTGGMLLDAAMSALRKKSVKRLYLEVRESNAGALALYESRGFALVSARRNYYRRPTENALVLALDLDLN